MLQKQYNYFFQYLSSHIQHLRRTQQKQLHRYKDWVNEKNFVFTPQTAMPMKGRAIHLTFLLWTAVFRKIL
jgi:hypothetical protein